MADINQHNPIENDELSEAHRLVSVIADGEATAAQRARFDQLASIDPSLWRELAHEQQTMGMLSVQLDRDLIAAHRVDLPANNQPAAGATATSSLRFPWMAAALGWAAVLVLAVVWMMTNNSGARPVNNNQNSAAPAQLPPKVEATGNAALEQYLESPWVRGQLQPTLLQVETLPDGSKRLWILRRIEEYIDLPADALVPLNEKNELTEEPKDLRDQSPQKSLGSEDRSDN